ncbi:MAG: aspartate 1-decarboxylase [Candidatus Bipolaricaulota bacterium]|nr:aspartate 1-decarboxylase [Candidatus Bipolaricaulota bacterium]MDW8140809.1 aspartate 1-decarboxylase [Candidatus Bipolaricaulota bacterium]
MRIELLKSKIHRATITATDLHYEGSLTLDSELMRAAQILPYEKVQVVNVNNGSRLETYVIEGPAHSGVVQLNGAAARWGAPGDLVIILTYASLEPAEALRHRPRVVHVDERNQIVEIV